IVHLVSNKGDDRGFAKIHFSNNPDTIGSTPPSILLAQNWKDVLSIIDEHLDGAAGHDHRFGHQPPPNPPQY
ncbi:MAG: hypothetical protein ACPGWR_33325, partial [Ardenticatenaceae bacterium]